MLKPATQIRPVQLLALASDQSEHDFASGPAWEIELAAAQVGVERKPPEWLQLLPKPDANHQIKARDGRMWTLEDPTVVLAHFQAYGADLVLDIEHASELKAPKGEEAPAQAWIKALQVREDGSVWGRADYTEAGERAVLSRSYRYISPAIIHDKETRRVTGLSSAALVTRPALHMPALASSGGRSLTENQEPSMTTATVALAALAGAAGLASNASEADVLARITANAQAARDLLDPTKYVPATDLAAAVSRAVTAETALAAKEQTDKDAVALASVEAAVAAGQIPPASKDHWVAVAKTTPEGFATAIASMPKIAGQVTETGKKVEGGGATDELGLTESQLALCSQMGLEPKAYAATLKETK